MNTGQSGLKVRTLSVLLFAGIVSAQTVIEEHWSPYDYPRQFDAGVKVHIIADGDTLWDISQTYFGDPLLWPQVYQANPYIKDPDLIYPGDPVVLDIGVVISGPGVAGDVSEGATGDLSETGVTDEFVELTEFTEGGEEEGEQVEDRSQTTSLLGSGTELVIIPAGDRTDVECSTYVYPLEERGDDLPFDFHVLGGEDALKLSFATHDVVYVDKGSDDGIQSGDVFSIRRDVGSVRNPVTRDYMGQAIDQIGKLRIIATQETGATAVITDSCDSILQMDFLVPYEQEPIPLITELPPFNRWDRFGTEGHGTIVYSEDELRSMGKGNLTNIDLGIRDNVAPGDILIIFRPNPHNDKHEEGNLPDIYVGQGVTLKSSDDTSVMKIIQGVLPIRVGDFVVPYQN